MHIDIEKFSPPMIESALKFRLEFLQETCSIDAFYEYPKWLSENVTAVVPYITRIKKILDTNSDEVVALANRFVEDHASIATREEFEYVFECTIEEFILSDIERETYYYLEKIKEKARN